LIETVGFSVHSITKIAVVREEQTCSSVDC
jgi:hypothetical protein